MNSKLSHWCNGLIEAGWLTVVIAIPLFFNIHSDRVFEPDKLTLLRSVALVMSLAWLVKFINDRAWQELDWLRWRSENSVWRRPFVLPVFLLVVVYLLSTLFSVTPTVSWAGSYQRLQGTYTTLSYIVVFALMAATMRTRAQVQRVITAVIITSIPIAFYGMLQRFGLDPLPWGGDTQRRIAGHMGNAIFIAAYLIMVVPLTLARIIDAFTNILNDDKLSYADVVRSSIYIFALAMQLLAIYWTSSRGPWIGLAVALFAFILILLVSLRNAEGAQRKMGLADVGKALALLLVGVSVSFLVINFLIGQIVGTGRLSSLDGPIASFVAFAAAVGLVTLVIFVLMAMRRGWAWLWLSWMLLALLVAAGLGAFNFADTLDERLGDSPLFGGLTETMVAWQDEPSIGRLGRLLESDRATGRVRVLIWEGVLDLIGLHEPLQFPDGREDRFNFLRPLIGYGPESMYVAYNRFYPPQLATVEARNASPDRSHNETFDALAITGWAGFLVWQALYVSVFYYGFKWLGVVRGKRDRNILIGLWIGGAVVATAVIVPSMGPPFLGVAVPFGSIIGLVVYLVYYALFVPGQGDGEAQDPFQPDRLLMMGLVTAVLAHYVEIHFGIAIAATRLHFFAFVGLMFVLGYVRPGVEAETAVTAAAPVIVKGRKRRATALPESKGLWGPAWLAAFMLALMLGILGYQFTTFSPLPNVTYQTPADLPVSDIFRQSFFVNSGNDFADSPFAFVLLILTWLLGVAVIAAEMVKAGELRFPQVDDPLPGNRQQLAGGAFLGVGLLSLILRFALSPPPDAGATWMLGQTLFLIAAVLSLWAAVRLLLKQAQARLTAGFVALSGLLFALPLLVAGNVLGGLATAVISGGLLYFVWQSDWRTSLLPAGVIAFASLAIGLLFTFTQAALLQSTLFFRPTQELQTPAQLLDFRVQEASQVASFLTLFYFFVIVIMLLSATAISWRSMAQTRESGATAGFASLAALSLLTLFLISSTNMRIIQADMIYKRAKPFDQQAGQQRNAQTWDVAIAIYNKALELAPREDFYYLFLGRAILERSALAETAAEQELLLQTASDRLIRAQEINPLNTDHTANLARLNTRWVDQTQDLAEKERRLTAAAQYYRDALALSPQNSVIRNEYGRLVYALQNDCDRALAVFSEAVEIDPYYAMNFLGRADTLIACAANAPEAEQRLAYEQALADMRAAIELGNDSLQVWLRVAQLNQELGDTAGAIEAYEAVRRLNSGGSVPAWQVEYLLATLYRDVGDTAEALAAAQEALRLAPPDSTNQVQILLAELTGQPIAEPPDPTSLSGERPLAQLPPAERNNIYNAPPHFVINPAGQYEAILTTEKGEIRLRLFADAAPVTVNNFVYLADQGFYDGTTFHRVLDGFMAQAGDPSGTGAGGPGYMFEDETNNGLGFDRPGFLAMANAGPNTNGSQFFITFAPTPWLDGGHTIFGEIIAGEAVLEALTRRDPQANPSFLGDVIERIEIVERP
jgi:cyclophilin family peptidyl-prolyl cis-trans isomerase/tetratricopeptide (TPR) repeat protein